MAGSFEIEWQRFRDMVIPKDAPQSQKEMMKLAFFSGAYNLFSKFLKDLDGGGDEPTERDMKNTSVLYSEIEYFLQTKAYPNRKAN